MPENLLELEAAVKRMPGVLGCVILAGADGRPSEIHAFVDAGVERAPVERTIADELAEVVGPPPGIFVFELDAQAPVGDRRSLERAAELAERDARSRPVSEEPPNAEPDPFLPRPRRPVVSSVALTSSSGSAQSRVALKLEEAEIVGKAEGEKTEHGLSLIGQATLDAAEKLTGGAGFKLRGASLVDLLGRQVVLVLVGMADGQDNVGAALVRGGPVTEAAVRATLAAVNRRLSKELA